VKLILTESATLIAKRELLCTLFQQHTVTDQREDESLVGMEGVSGDRKILVFGQDVFLVLPSVTLYGNLNAKVYETTSEGQQYRTF
jgi:hypothetical protein